MAARIRDVWATNLDTEMRNIRDLIERYPYVAMDTEFPGVIARPIGVFRTSGDYHYQTMRCNVDLLRIIQIGLTLADERGNMPEEVCTWQFNFHFDLGEDMFSPDSIDLLRGSGIDFGRHASEGILPNEFAELLITSGLVLSEETKWICFHAGYDFGYLVKLLSCMPLPTMEEDFFEMLSLWFPTVFDVKYMMRTCKMRGGLQDGASVLEVQRIGPVHQAGSDSLLTANVFFKMREAYKEDLLDDSEYNGRLYGLGKTAPLTMTNGMYDSTSAHGLASYGRSAITTAERERTPPPRENVGVGVNSVGQNSHGHSQAQGQQGGMGLGAPGMMGAGGPGLTNPGAPGMGGGFANALGSPYGQLPVSVNGAYHLRQINVGGDR